MMFFPQVGAGAARAGRQANQNANNQASPSLPARVNLDQNRRRQA
jgi:hypothetical protein